MNTTLRFLALGLTVLLMVASCGQKGPLHLPEEGSASAHPTIFDTP